MKNALDCFSFVVTTLWIMGFLFAYIEIGTETYASSDCFAYLKRQVPGVRGTQPGNTLGIGTL